MKVFNLRDNLIVDYSKYIKSFINIKDQRIYNRVFSDLDNGLLWPDPLIQLNPAFTPGSSIDNLVLKQILHHECSKIFRKGKSEVNPIGSQMILYKHQEEAVQCAKGGHHYILTTGTGSGKSLSYIIPIVDYVLKNGSGKGIKAIIVYPMNALANSQENELKKFLHFGYSDKHVPVSFGKYTGQEKNEQRKQITDNPPDILLTNYVMLELILTRPDDFELVNAAQGIQFLVFDELHSYRGRQGADVALLIRRAKESFGGHHIQCIGTSATLAGPGSFQEQKEEVAEVAAKIFGEQFLPANIIMETLIRRSSNFDKNDPVFIDDLKKRVDRGVIDPTTEYESFINDPLTRWLESMLGVTKDASTDCYRRVEPKAITGKYGIAKELSALTGINDENCAHVIKEHLLSSYECEPDPTTGFSIFAFRLHQFISRGDTVYASLDNESTRYITLSGQQYVPHIRTSIILPLVFCRECGQEYYCVYYVTDAKTGSERIEKRSLSDRFSDEENEAGFLYLNTENPWPISDEEMIESLPDEWLEEYKGTLRIRKTRKKSLPRPIYITPDGIINKSGALMTFIPAPFRFCIHCGISYGFRQGSDYTKLTSLSTEGRSNAITVLCLNLIRRLKKEGTLSVQSRKLLSFTDNRQDASLQAGHFNDFVETGILRGAAYKAIEKAGSNGLHSDEIVFKVFEALDLPFEVYASDPEVRFAARDEKKRALQEVLGYRIYRDLKRGWRIIAPNLEQCGLLEITYPYLDKVCATEDIWEKTHPALANASKETRAAIAKTLLDHMRRELCIKVEYLQAEYQSRIYSLSFQHLILPWALDENEHEQMERAGVLFPYASGEDNYRGTNVYLSPRGAFGQYLRRRKTFPDYQENISVVDTALICENLLECLKKGGLVEVVIQGKSDAGYQIPANAMVWLCGDGTIPYHDPLRVPNLPEGGGRTNEFFVHFYKTVLPEVIGIEAREHTAQVKAEVRQEREREFGKAALPVLFCSPTMELGVDIKELNAVNMRNVPPTPANYSQRSGRAGRSGQPALVFTYCSTYSSHDQYFFRRPGLMVGGVVAPPRIDLSNEDLIRSHIHALWLQISRLYLGMTLAELLDVEGDEPSLDFNDRVKDVLYSESNKRETYNRAKTVLESLGELLKDADWYSPQWLKEAIEQIPMRFNNACERWRILYRSAVMQRDIQHKMVNDRSKTQDERNRAKVRRAQAESQINLLTECHNVYENDFYSYRYFASEGFIPGYNFPRLPLSAFIPARRLSGKNDDYLSRPRFLAISEFGPRAVIYHEGSRYRINQVVLSPDSREDTGDIVTTHAKLCTNCGYTHPVIHGDGPDKCELCDYPLSFKMNNLFRIQNVTTKRSAKINSDEEERIRTGFELCTGIRFEQQSKGSGYRIGSVSIDEKEIASLVYSDAATIWRLNMGWIRRARKDVLGFMLDTNNGYWATNEQDRENDEEDPLSPQTRRVIPFVEDHRNCLLFTPKEKLEEAVFLSLQAAFKHAIQVLYQLEESELAVEPLPSKYTLKHILFYESSEGGAGVLKRLIDEGDAIPAIARKALEICHFDPDTGKDLQHAPNSEEVCEAACYDCLLSYMNQPDHSRLDRMLIKEYLMSLQGASVSSSSSRLSRTEHLKRLLRHCQSSLEKEWLEFLNIHNLKLPSEAQPYIEKCGTRPDFLYEEDPTAIYIDGPDHEYPDRIKRDIEQTECMENSGFSVVRFTAKDDWKEIIAKHPGLFGRIV